VVREGTEALIRAREPRHRRQTIGALAVAVVGFVSIGGGVVMTTPWASRSALLARDPFIGFFFVQRQYEFVEARVAIRHRREGPAARAAYAGVSGAARRNVVLIVVDSLRADHMEVYGYPRRTTPFLESLRQAGRLRAVRRAMSSCAESNCGISSILSSKTLGSTLPENFKLHDLLHDQGYRLHFILSGKHEWFGLREFYGDEMETYFDGTRAARHAATDDRVLLEGLAAIPPADGRPTYLHFHLMSTHQIGVRQERYQVFLPAQPHGRPGADLQSRVNGYDNAVIQADAIMAELFAGLQQKGYLDDALVMIVADHGESLGAPGEDAVGHGPSLGHEVLNIPWLVVDGDFSTYRNLEFGTQVDVAPTIVSRLGLPVPATWEGRSLLQPLDGTISFHYSNFAGRATYAVVQARGPELWKLVQSRNGEELFELNSDPDEQRDVVAAADRELVTGLRAGLAARVTATFPEN
jgi:glucan phosphoethanolaminetransferase (alkaline phosphatase superfamily)